MRQSFRYPMSVRMIDQARCFAGGGVRVRPQASVAQA